MANGRSNYGRYGGWGNLIAGQRGLYNNPQYSFTQGLRTGMQFQDPRMAQKIMMAQLKLAQTEKDVSKNLEDYFTTADVDMTAVHENDIPILTDYLAGVKVDYFAAVKNSVQADNPVDKARYNAEIKKMRNNMTSVYANFTKYKEYQRFAKDGFHDFSKHNPEDYQTFLSLIDPNAERTIVDGELKITGKDGNLYSMAEFEDLLPTIKPVEYIQETSTAVKGYINNKMLNDITEPSVNISQNLLSIMQKAIDKDSEDNNADVIRSMVAGEIFDGESFLDSAKFQSIQDEWKNFTDDEEAGSWINADDQEYYEFQQYMAEKNKELGSLKNEWANWATEEIETLVKKTNYNPSGDPKFSFEQQKHHDNLTLKYFEAGYVFERKSDGKNSWLELVKRDDGFWDEDGDDDLNYVDFAKTHLPRNSEMDTTIKGIEGLEITNELKEKNFDYVDINSLSKDWGITEDGKSKVEITYEESEGNKSLGLAGRDKLPDNFNGMLPGDFAIVTVSGKDVMKINQTNIKREHYPSEYAYYQAIREAEAKDKSTITSEALEYKIQFNGNYNDFTQQIADQLAAVGIIFSNRSAAGTPGDIIKKQGGN